MNDPNAGFVLAAYVMAFVVITGMILATIADYFGLKKTLARLAGRAGAVDDPRT